MQTYSVDVHIKVEAKSEADALLRIVSELKKDKILFFSVSQPQEVSDAA